MRIHLLLSSTCLLLLSCEPQTEISPESEKDQQASLSIISNRILEPDAPKLELNSITQNSFIGNHFTFKRVFLESFENIEIPRLPTPGAGPEYIVKRDENDSGLIPVNKGRLRLRRTTLHILVKFFDTISQESLSTIQCTRMDFVREKLIGGGKMAIYQNLAKVGI